MGGLYLVTSPVRPLDRLASIVAAALDGGASLVQLREKTSPMDEKLAAARAVHKACRSRGVPFLVNDDPEFARRVGAGGVHVGREDPSPRIARALLGPRALVGVTVYGKPGEEQAAESAGADYLGVGPFFPSPTKPEEPELPLHVLDQVMHRSHVPVFAIGGITAENAGLLARHGIAGIAVVSEIMNATDPRGASQSLLQAFRTGASQP